MTLSQQDLANLVGTSRESVNKQLRAWEAAGIVRVSRQRVIIVAPDQLEDGAWPC
jgi:CRP-like cAMP-binding protein